MRRKTYTKMHRILTIIGMGAAVAMSASADPAVLYLKAAATTVTMPGNVVVPMWGYAACDDDTFTTCGSVSAPGPTLVVPPDKTGLTIQLKNTLPVATSIIIPGQTNPMAPTSYCHQRQGPREVFHCRSGAKWHGELHFPESSAGYIHLSQWNTHSSTSADGTLWTGTGRRW